MRVDVLGEKLVAFRATDGRVGLLDAYCPHRRANLFWGRNEQDGLRCVYHGWKFDVTGRCTDLPNCPEGPTLKDRVRTRAYPTLERGGLVFAYLGPEACVPSFRRSSSSTRRPNGGTSPRSSRAATGCNSRKATSTRATFRFCTAVSAICRSTARARPRTRIATRCRAGSSPRPTTGSCSQRSATRVPIGSSGASTNI